jgi:superfamily II DNA or RNA helicase
MLQDMLQFKRRRLEGANGGTPPPPARSAASLRPSRAAGRRGAQVVVVAEERVRSGAGIAPFLLSSATVLSSSGRLCDSPEAEAPDQTMRSGPEYYGRRLPPGEAEEPEGGGGAAARNAAGGQSGQGRSEPFGPSSSPIPASVPSGSMRSAGAAGGLSVLDVINAARLAGQGTDGGGTDARAGGGGRLCRARTGSTAAALAASPLDRDVRCVINRGAVLQLKDLSAAHLSYLQKSLTHFPPNLFDRSAPSEPVLAYAMSEHAITVPRFFGHRLYRNSVDDLSDGDLMARGFGGSLRPLQAGVVDSAMSKLTNPPHGCVVCLPCGGGKTVVAIDVIARLGRRAIVVVHKEFLLAQWIERIKTFLPGATVGVLQGKKEQIDRDVCLGMIQTIVSRDYDPHFFDGFATLVVDESHHCPARTFSQLFFKHRIRHVLGLTATPKRKDGLTELLNHYMGEFAAVIEDGSLLRECKIYRVKYRSAHRRMEDLNPAGVVRVKTKLVADERRNRLLLSVCLRLSRTGRKIIVLSERVNHLKSLSEAFGGMCGAGCTRSLYIGETKAKDRERAGAAQVIFATFSLAAEGLDLPALDTLILASPFSDVVQSVGRILRICEGKQTPLVVDIVDDTCQAFERNANTRLGIYARSSYEVNEVSDGADWPPNSAPVC